MLIADTCISILWDLVLRGQQLELKSLPSVPLDAAVVYPQEREQVQSRNLRKMPEFYCNTIWPQCNLDGDVWSKAERRLMQLDLVCKIQRKWSAVPYAQAFMAIYKDRIQRKDEREQLWRLGWSLFVVLIYKQQQQTPGLRWSILSCYGTPCCFRSLSFTQASRGKSSAGCVHPAQPLSICVSFPAQCRCSSCWCTGFFAPAQGQTWARQGRSKYLLPQGTLSWGGKGGRKAQLGSGTQRLTSGFLLCLDFCCWDKTP